MSRIFINPSEIELQEESVISINIISAKTSKGLQNNVN